MVVVVAVGGGLKVTLVFCFGPKPNFCSFDLDLDQAEQYCVQNYVIILQSLKQIVQTAMSTFHLGHTVPRLAIQTFPIFLADPVSKFKV